MSFIDILLVVLFFVLLFVLVFLSEKRSHKERNWWKSTFSDIRFSLKELNEKYHG